jgi:hypothetical protein
MYNRPFILYWFYFSNTHILSSWDNVVGIATSYGLDDQGVGVRVPVESRIHIVKTGSGVHPTSYPVGTRGSFSAGKAANHLPPTSAEVKKS